MPRSLLATLFVAAVVAVCLGGLFPRGAAGDRINPPEARARAATHVFVGRVTDVWSKTKEVERHGVRGTERHFLVEVTVEAVERGAMAPEDVVYVRAFRRTTTGDSVGMAGHDPIPETGDRVRVYAVRGPYEDTGQTDNGMVAAYANGFEILPREATPQEPGTSR